MNDKFINHVNRFSMAMNYICFSLRGSLNIPIYCYRWFGGRGLINCKLKLKYSDIILSLLWLILKVSIIVWFPGQYDPDESSVARGRSTWSSWTGLPRESQPDRAVASANGQGRRLWCVCRSTLWEWFGKLLLFYSNLNTVKALNFTCAFRVGH